MMPGYQAIAKSVSTRLVLSLLSKFRSSTEVWNANSRKYQLFDGKMRSFREEGGTVKSEEEKRQMAEKRRFKQNREFKKRLDEQEENEEADIRNFKFRSLEKKSRESRAPREPRGSRESKFPRDTRNSRDSRDSRKPFKKGRNFDKGKRRFDHDED